MRLTEKMHLGLLMFGHLCADGYWNSIPTLLAFMSIASGMDHLALAALYTIGAAGAALSTVVFGEIADDHPGLQQAI